MKSCVYIRIIFSFFSLLSDSCLFTLPLSLPRLPTLTGYSNTMTQNKKKRKGNDIYWIDNKKHNFIYDSS